MGTRRKLNKLPEFPVSEVSLSGIKFAMFLTRSEYDRGVNTFSPEGRLFQVEYAIEAIKLGSTAIGIRTNQGVLLAVEKRGEALKIPSSIEKILEIVEHMGCAMSGLTSDARTLVDHARVEAQTHWFTYNERMPVESCVNSVADMALDFSDTNKDRKRVMSRPFGVALLVGGYDPVDGPVLFNTDPSGTFTKYLACAIGSAQEGATSMLQEQYNKDMTIKEAETLGLTVLRQVMEEKLSKTNIEVGTIRADTKKFYLYSPDELEVVIQGLPAPTQPTLQTAAASST